MKPSPWLERWAPLVASGGSVLDVAAGSGRHALWLAERGHAVTAVDRDAAALAGIGAGVQTLLADLEDAPWPLPGRCFDAVVVTNYLWRPLWPFLRDALAPGGLLVVETFAAGNESVGRPRNPEYLLAPGELLSVAQGLRIVAYEDGFLDAPARFVQRLVAVRSAPATLPARYPLAPASAPAGSVESPATPSTP